MAQSTQTRASHTRWFPIFHFVALPVTLAYAIRSLWLLFASPMGPDALWNTALAVAIACAVLSARVMAVTVQDRVIRLEETLRMQQILPAAQRGDIGKVTRQQFVALRFAADAELPDLVRRTAGGELVSQKQIKDAIREWRPDFLRA